MGRRIVHEYLKKIWIVEQRMQLSKALGSNSRLTPPAYMTLTQASLSLSVSIQSIVRWDNKIDMRSSLVREIVPVQFFIYLNAENFN